MKLSNNKLGNDFMKSDELSLNFVFPPGFFFRITPPPLFCDDWGGGKFNIRRQLVSFLMLFSENRYILKRRKTILFFEIIPLAFHSINNIFPI